MTTIGVGIDAHQAQWRNVMKLGALSSRVLAAVSVLALSALAPALAQEAPPRLIRLAGPGNAEGKPFGIIPKGGARFSDEEL